MTTARVLTSQRHNKVQRDQHQALHIVALAVLDEEVDEEDGYEEDDGLEVREEEGEVVVRDPADDHKQRYNERRNLLFETGIAALVKFVLHKAVGRKPKAERNSRSSCRHRCR